MDKKRIASSREISERFHYFFNNGVLEKTRCGNQLSIEEAIEAAFTSQKYTAVQEDGKIDLYVDSDGLEYCQDIISSMEKNSPYSLELETDDYREVSIIMDRYKDGYPYDLKCRISED